MSVAPFDNLTTVLNTVRVRLGDDVNSLLPLGGQIASNSQADSQQMTNTGWRKLQEHLVFMGCVLLQPPPVVISGFGVAVPLNAATETYVSWSEYFDGTTHHVSPVLPQDLIEPIEVQERPASIGNFNKMDLILGAMPAVTQTAWNGAWQWRQSKLVMPGASAAFDLRVSYAGYFVDFLDTGDVTTAVGFVPWYQQPVPIMRALESLAGFICAEVEIARGNQNAAITYTAEAKEAAGMIVSKDFSRDKGVMRTVEYGKMKDPYTPGGSPLTNSPGAGV